MSSVLSNEKLLAALQAWPLPEPLTIQELPGGMTCEVWYFPKGNQAHNEFMQAYLREAPISAGELRGIKYYKALLWTRQAKFYAYCVAENVTLGGSTPTSNAENLAKSWRELESWLARL